MTHVGTEINPSTFEHPTLAFLRDYWDAKRGGRTMPSRADIRASDIKEHLGWVILVDVLPEAKDFRYRLIGTLVTQYWLKDSTGKTVGEAFAGKRPGGSEGGAVGLPQMRARHAASCARTAAQGWLPGGFERFDSIYMPLSDDGEACHPHPACVSCSTSRK